MKGFEFAEKWYHAECVPSHIAGLYRLLLKLIWMEDIMAVSYAQRLGYSMTVVNKALSEGYVKIAERPIGLSEAVRDRIVRMIGEAPREIYA